MSGAKKGAGADVSVKLSARAAAWLDEYRKAVGDFLKRKTPTRREGLELAIRQARHSAIEGNTRQGVPLRRLPSEEWADEAKPMRPRGRPPLKKKKTGGDA